MLSKVALTCLAVLALAGCGGGFSPDEDDLVVYSGREEELPESVRALHAAFELGGEEEAQVYAGTGR